MVTSLLDTAERVALTLLTVQEAREVFGVSRSSVYRWIDRLKIRRAGRIDGENGQQVVLLEIVDEELQQEVRDFVRKKSGRGRKPLFLAQRIARETLSHLPGSILATEVGPATDDAGASEELLELQAEFEGLLLRLSEESLSRNQLIDDLEQATTKLAEEAREAHTNTSLKDVIQVLREIRLEEASIRNIAKRVAKQARLPTRETEEPADPYPHEALMEEVSRLEDLLRNEGEPETTDAASPDLDAVEEVLSTISSEAEAAAIEAIEMLKEAEEERKEEDAPKTEEPGALEPDEVRDLPEPEEEPQQGPRHDPQQDSEGHDSEAVQGIPEFLLTDQMQLLDPLDSEPSPPESRFLPEYDATVAPLEAIEEHDAEQGSWVELASDEHDSDLSASQVLQLDQEFLPGTGSRAEPETEYDLSLVTEQELDALERTKSLEYSPEHAFLEGLGLEAEGSYLDINDAAVGKEADLAPVLPALEEDERTVVPAEAAVEPARPDLENLLGEDPTRDLPAWLTESEADEEVEFSFPGEHSLPSWLKEGIEEPVDAIAEDTADQTAAAADGAEERAPAEAALTEEVAAEEAASEEAGAEPEEPEEPSAEGSASEEAVSGEAVSEEPVPDEAVSEDPAAEDGTYFDAPDDSVELPPLSEEQGIVPEQEPPEAGESQEGNTGEEVESLIESLAEGLETAEARFDTGEDAEQTAGSMGEQTAPAATGTMSSGDSVREEVLDLQKSVEELRDQIVNLSAPVDHGAPLDQVVIEARSTREAIEELGQSLAPRSRAQADELGLVLVIAGASMLLFSWVVIFRGPDSNLTLGLAFLANMLGCVAVVLGKKRLGGGG